jgi:hypothetical protein
MGSGSTSLLETGPFLGKTHPSFLFEYFMPNAEKVLKGFFSVTANFTFSSYALGFFVPYLERPWVRLLTPAESSAPLMR